MRTNRLLALLWALGALGCSDSVNTAPDFAKARPPVDNPDGLQPPPAEAKAYIVVFKAAVTDPESLADELVRIHGGQLKFRYRSALKGFAARLPAQALDGIRRNPNVDFLEADGIVSVSESQHRPPSWGLDRIDQRDPGLDRYYTYQNSGAGVRVYVVDTGVELSHIEFGGRATSGWDFVDNDSDASDCYGHGTHVAGTVAGTTVGVAKQASIVSVRVMDCAGEGWWSQFIAGLDWIVANHGKPAVVNLSIGGDLSSAANAAVDNVVTAGVTVMVAAGNENTDACTRSPASATNALTVGATTTSDARAGYSNYGTCVDLFAPGSTIYSAMRGGGYLNLSGTSMAAPHVAGVAALYLSSHPAATPAAVRDAVIRGATVNQVGDAGTGSPNRLLFSLIASDGPSPPPPPPAPPTASFSSSCTGLNCQFTDQSIDSDGSVTVWQWDFGDGNVSSARNPMHSFAATGTYLVRLVAQDNSGAKDTVSQGIVVAEAPSTNLAPIASFTAGCVQLACDFVDASQDPDGSIARWEWYFGDGASLVNVASTGPSHVFPTVGTYQVRLVVQDNVGATDTVSQEVVVADAPVVNLPPSASFTARCVRLDCAFLDASLDSDGSIGRWEWNFGDGASLANVTATGASHVFAAGAVYRISLTVTDDVGATSSIVQDLAVGPVLAVSGYKLKGKPMLNLKWTGIESGQVDIYLNGLRQATVNNTGASTYVGSGKGQVTYRVRICEAGTAVCSLEQTISL